MSTNKSSARTKKIPDIAVILNVYMRGEQLSKQIDALAQQSIKPNKIYIWQNGENYDIPEEILKIAVVAKCNQNLGVWARLAFALNIRSEYICMLDDDTIPGTRWLENCIQTMATHEGLLGTRGLKFKSQKSYRWSEEFGWNAPNETVEEVDIVGHSWFFRTSWLTAFWGELPPSPFPETAGEDMHFSYAIQKKLGLSTYVPPHPKSQPELWGSIPETAIALGTSSVAISKQPGSLSKFQKVYLSYIERGFEIQNGASKSRTIYELNKDKIEDSGIGAEIRKSILYKWIFKK